MMNRRSNTKRRIGEAARAAVILIICVCLTACDSADYQRANEYFDNGEFEAALELYMELGDYEDSQEYAKKCKYEIANGYLLSGMYKEAFVLYAELNGYEDSADQAAFCEREAGLRENADYYFLQKIEESVLDRMQKAALNVFSNTILINTELAHLEQFAQEHFYDDHLKELAEQYLEGLYIQREALKQEIYSDYQLQWQKGLAIRCAVMKDLYENYGFLADNAEFVGTYVTQYEDVYNLWQAYEAIETDISVQTTAEDFTWRLDGYYVTCTLTNNTDYTFSTTFQMQYYDADGTQFATGSAHVDKIAPGERYIVNCYISEPSKLVSYKWSNFYGEVYF